MFTVAVNRRSKKRITIVSQDGPAFLCTLGELIKKLKSIQVRGGFSNVILECEHQRTPLMLFSAYHLIM